MCVQPETSTGVIHDWLNLVPLYHFMTGQSEPCQPLKMNYNHQEETWWGIKDIVKISEKYKYYVEYGDSL